MKILIGINNENTDLTAFISINNQRTWHPIEVVISELQVTSTWYSLVPSVNPSKHRHHHSQ